ncbi:microsomal triglyceride transfer protein-like [Rhinophrynus dorsalis]
MVVDPVDDQPVQQGRLSNERAAIRQLEYFTIFLKSTKTLEIHLKEHSQVAAMQICMEVYGAVMQIVHIGDCVVVHLNDPVNGNSCFSQGPSFQPGISYQYNYTVNLIVEHHSQLSMPGTKLKVDASIQTYLVWRNKTRPEEQLVHVQIQDCVVEHLLGQNKSYEIGNCSSIKNVIDTGNSSKLGHPFLFHWISGKVVGLYVTGEENGRTLDLKRGLVSLFQFQPISGTHIEEDVCGRCLVTYDMSKNVIRKTKDLHSCTSSQFGSKDDHKVFRVSLNSTSKGYLSLNGNIIQRANSEENHTVSLNVKSQLGSRIASRQQLELKSTIPGPAEIPGDNLQKIFGELPVKYQKIDIASHPLRRDEGSQLLKNYLKTSKGRVKKLNISKASTTKHFHAFVKMLRQAKKRDILQLLQKASGEFVPFCIDAAVSAQTSASLAALSEFLDFSKKKQSALQNRFLHSAAFVPHPSKELLNIILEKLKGKVSDPVIMETGIVITGAIIGKLCRMGLCDLKDVEIAKAILVEGLHEAEDESEIKIYLLALKNAQLPETIPILLQFAEDKVGAVSSAALSALQVFPAEYISTEEVKSTLRWIFHQTHQEYDKTSRLLAAETLLATDYLPMDLTNILLGLDQMKTEASKLLLSKLQNRQSFKHPFMKAEKNILKDLHDYGRFSRSGRSTAFSGLLTATKDMASTYSLDLLFAESGLLKRSVSDITLLNQNHQLKAMQVSIEVEGLDSLIGDGIAEEDEEEENDATVGMSAVLFDVHLRPIVFFQGYMDLVSKVFSSSGEPTSVLKGNVLMIDYLKFLPMQSGLQAIVEYQGGLGLEVSANIDVSIWEQESKTNINTKAGIVFEFKAEVDTAFFQADIQSQAEAEITVDFDSIMKFSSFPMEICLELRQDDVPYREKYILTETFPEKNITHTVRKGRKSTLWGRDFPFHSANSEMCKNLLTENEQ